MARCTSGDIGTARPMAVFFLRRRFFLLTVVSYSLVASPAGYCSALGLARLRRTPFGYIGTLIGLPRNSQQVDVVGVVDVLLLLNKFLIPFFRDP